MFNIDPEFRSLIPSIGAEEYAQLEANIIKDGCRDPLVVWQNTLIDGHNRHGICTKHGQPFKTVEMEFSDREKAKEWIILNQFGRRNLSAYDRSLLALKLKELFAEKAKEKQYEGINQHSLCQKSDKPTMDTKKELAKIAGVSHDTIHKVEKIEAKATPQQKAQIKNSQVSINKVYNDLVREEKRQSIVENVKPRELPIGLFDVILADPPWRYEFAETENRAIENQYPTMELEEIKKLKIPSAENSVLFLWATAPKLEEAQEVMRAWGFGYRTCAVWDKEVIGMGYWFRGQHELLLVGAKGNFSAPEPANRFSSVIREKRTNHSKKPECVYGMLEKMFPQGRYLEMFARKNMRPLWSAWGNES